MSDNKLTNCQECGMLVATNEYHPFGACLMFKATGSSDSVTANLNAIKEDAIGLAKLLSQSDNDGLEKRLKEGSTIIQMMVTEMPRTLGEPNWQLIYDDLKDALKALKRCD